jgi:hypothetical protein
MAGPLLLLITSFLCSRLEANYLTGFSPKTSNNNKALEQLFSTVIYAAILSIDFIYAWSARASQGIIFNTRRNWCNRFGWFAFQDIAANFYRYYPGL